MLQKEALCIYDTRERFVSFCSTLMNLTEEKQIVLLALPADLKDTFDNCSACEDEAILVISYLLSDGAKEMHEAKTASGMRTDAPVYYSTWAEVIKALT